MAGEKLLNEAQCKAARSREALYYLNDGGGLRLRVRPNGSRHWLFRYRVASKEKTTSLGAYPQVSLKQARQKAWAARTIVAEGKDPVVVRRVAKTKNAAASQELFESVAAAWLRHNRETSSSHHYERNSGLIRRYLLPSIGKLPIDSIDESYLFGVLKKVYDSGTKESARRTRAVAAQIFSHGRALHLCKFNPAKDMADNPYFKKPPVEHYKALPQEQTAALMSKLAQRGPTQPLEITTIVALQMALYTGLRDSSIRAARWNEIDFERKVWSVPGNRMKSRRDHVLPLPTQAIEILRELEAHTFRSPDSFIFASTRSKTGFMAENTLRKALHSIGFQVTAHGMRSLITDVLYEAGYSRDLIEKQLDHKDRDQVRAAYLRTNFLEQRAPMMQWFADWCAGKEAVTNVISLRSS